MRYLLFALLFISVASCQKPSAIATREDDLRMGKWIIVSEHEDVDPYSGNDTTYNIYDSILASCQKDDYLVFGMNYRGTQNTGTKCSDADPDLVEFQWDLFNNGNGINFWFANETFFGEPAISAPFLNYSPTQFTIRYTKMPYSSVDPTQHDTLTITTTFRRI
jgi:hypothetical protein